jgi:hypothetical protein
MMSLAMMVEIMTTIFRLAMHGTNGNDDDKDACE